MHEPWVNGIIKKWTLDKIGDELYELIIHKEKMSFVHVVVLLIQVVQSLFLSNNL